MPHYDYDKDYPFAAFITNLGKYNEGALVGEWVKFPTTAEELKKVFERIGIGAKDDFGQTYEEWFITDYDCYVDGLYDLLGEYANLDELNYLASKLDDMSQDEYERFQAAMEIGDHTGSIQELINLTENLDCYDVYPDIHDHDDLGRYYIEELDAMQVPEHLRNYIDYEAYGRDIALEESGQFTDLGYVRDMLALVDSADKAPIRLIGLGMILLDEIVQTSKTKITTGNKHLRDFYLKEALSYIERNFQRNVSIEKIADASGLNRSYFSRLFKETFGQPPQQFLIQYRLTKAAELLKNTRISVAEVGRSVGYDNQLHFSRAFRSVFGVPPSEYRNLHYFHTEK